MQPSELEGMEYYEFHYLVKDLMEHLKNENDRNSGSQDESGKMMNSVKMPKMQMPKMKL